MKVSKQLGRKRQTSRLENKSGFSALSLGVLRLYVNDVQFIAQVSELQKVHQH